MGGVNTLVECDLAATFKVTPGAPGQMLPELDVRVIRDREPHLGPLAGLREGLSVIQHGRAFVTATDAPFLTSRFIQDLVAREEPVAPEVGGFVQTLCAVYPAEAGERAEGLLSENRRRPLELIESMNFLKLPERELVDPQSLSGFNTPDAYLDAVRKLDPDARAEITMGNGDTISMPVSNLEDMLRTAKIETEDIEVTSGQGILFDQLSAPIGAGEHLHITYSSKS